MSYWRVMYLSAAQGHAAQTVDNQLFRHIATERGELQCHCVDPVVAALRRLELEQQMNGQIEFRGGCYYQNNPLLEKWTILASGS